jgi:glycosyltransferase involved in cell wall biosynthesis
MRILMASHGYPPTLSGVTLVVQKLARAMVRKGHEVTVVTAGERHNHYEDEDQAVRLLHIHALSNPFWKEGPIPYLNKTEMEEVIDEVQPEILHAHEAAILGFQTQRIGHDLGLPLLATCYYVPRFVARYLTWDDEPQGLVEEITWAYSTWIFGQFDHVVFATQAHRRYYVEHGLEVPTSIISNGVDTVRYHPPDADDPEEVETRYRLPPHPRILFVSRLARDKEIDVLIQAMPQVTAEREAHLLLVGRGQDRERLEEISHELGMRPYVHFVGFVPEEDMPAIYRASDLFAIASTCEVQSLPTLQAAATALPLVVADAVALPELVNDGVNGFLVPPGDPEAMAEAIGRILRDPALAARMGQASLDVAAPHAEAHTFDQYEALYGRMIEEQPGRE